MTPAQQAFLTRKGRYEQPAQTAQGSKRKTMGLLSSLLGAPTGDIPLGADQGPLPDGGNLYQGSALPTAYSGGTGKPALALGNPNREQIKIGPFFRPRVDQAAAQALAVDPLAPVQLEQPTTGVGGFFRRMLGDDANERNAARAEQQGQLRLQKWLMDQENAGRMGIVDKEHQYRMEQIKAEAAAREGLAQYNTQLGLQSEQVKNDWALKQEAEKARQAMGLKRQALTDTFGDPIKASMFMEREALAPIERAEAQSAVDRAQAAGTGGFTPRPVATRATIPGYKHLNDNVYLDPTGQPVMLDDETGAFKPIGFGGAGSPGGFTPEQQAAIKADQAAMELQAAQTPITEGSALSGLGSIAGDAISTVFNYSPVGLGLKGLKSLTKPVIGAVQENVLNPAAELDLQNKEALRMQKLLEIKRRNQLGNPVR